MAWKPVRTTTEVEAEVDAADLRTEVLLQALIDRKVIGAAEAAQVLERGGFDADTAAPSLFGDDGDEDDEPDRPDIDWVALERAEDEVRRGHRAETFVLLERALGGDFVGRLAEAH